MSEVELFLRLRQLRDEPRPTYLLRVARAASGSMASAADRLSPRGYAWILDAQARIAAGGYPLDFDDERVEVSVADQLFDLLEVEDEIERTKEVRQRKSGRAREGRRGDYDRIAQFILLWPGASNLGVAEELSSTGWSVDRKRVAEVRAELRRCLGAMKSSGILVRLPNGDRIIGL
jgi:hypothetical protein